MSRISNQASNGIAATLAYGTVTQLSPLEIVRESDSGRTALPASLLVLSPLCTKYSIVHKDETIKVWAGLDVDDRVFLISLGSGQPIYVERVSMP